MAENAIERIKREIATQTQGDLYFRLDLTGSTYLCGPDSVAIRKADANLLLAVAEAAAQIVQHMTPIEHPKSPTDYAYGKVTNEQWRALVAAVAPLLEDMPDGD